VISFSICCRGLDHNAFGDSDSGSFPWSRVPVAAPGPPLWRSILSHAHLVSQLPVVQVVPYGVSSSSHVACACLHIMPAPALVSAMDCWAAKARKRKHQAQNLLTFELLHSTQTHPALHPTQKVWHLGDFKGGIWKRPRAPSH